MTNRLVFLTVFVVIVSCSRAFDPEIRTGSHLFLADGPQVLLSAISYMDDDQNPVVDIDLEILLGSLIYHESDGEFTASVTVETEFFEVLEGSDGELRRVHVMEEELNVANRNRNITESREFLTYNERISLPPGSYRVAVRTTDQSSGQTTTRQANVTVFDPQSDKPNLTHIKIFGEQELNGAVVTADYPLTTYSIPGRIDTLKFEYQVTRPADGPALKVEMNLVQFESDLNVPRSMSENTPSRGSIAHRGINYNRREVVESQERILEQETGTITIEYKTVRPPRGNYRFEVMLSELQNGEATPIEYKARDFSSMSDNFPNVVSAREFAEPLVYLMRGSRYREMMNIQHPDSLKREVDRFWLSHLNNENLALRVLEEYYGRVEEANKQFSNFKEGWMTDMGMMYILFGPPWYVERSLDTIIWIYSYDRSDPRRVFFFQRSRIDSDIHPFEHYVLQRNVQYHSVEYEQVQRWLSGSILTRPI